MNDSDDLSSEQELAAWDKWKEICFIGGCPEEARTYLRRRVIYAMRELLKKIGSEDHNVQVNGDDIVMAFDLFMAYKDGAPVDIGVARRSASGSPPDSAKGRSAYTQHKDYIWHKMLASSDPPMKVLNGKLLGPQGIIMDVCEWLIKKHFMVFQKTKVDKVTGERKRRFGFYTSLDAPLTDDSDTTSGENQASDIFPAPDQAAAESELELEQIAQKLLGTLKVDEKTVLLAMLSNMNCSAPELCAALGRQKSASCQLASRLTQRLRSWNNSDAEVPWGMSFYTTLVAALYAELRQQKSQTQGMKDFLATIERLQSSRYGVNN